MNSVTPLPDEFPGFSPGVPPHGRPVRSPAGPKGLPAARPAGQSHALDAVAAAVARRACELGEPLEFAGHGAVLGGPELRQPAANQRWLVCPAGDDPFVRAGSLPVPAVVREKLARLSGSGLAFPTVVVAHQVDPGQVPPVADILRAPGEGVSHAAAKALLGDAPAHPATEKRAAALGRAAGGLARGVRSAGVAALGGGAALVGVVAAAPLLLVDPIVLGGVTAPGAGSDAGTPAAWFVLGRWDW